MFKTLRKFISNNIYFIVGILIGLFICNSVLYVDETCDHYTENDEEFKIVDQNPIPPKKFVVAVKNQTKVKHEASTVKKKKLVRPRYYSTELGIRSKLFVGIFTSEERVNTQGIYINKTIGHLVDKIKYFITAQYKVKSKFNLTGLVGFTDTRYKYRPFQIIKYIGDNFGQEYDYYFLADDYTYINIHTLKKSINKISVSMDVYLGTKEVDSSYCNLDSGIILSNSVLKALRDHLDWCVINTVSDSHSENIARCVHHSIGLTCQDSVQDQSIGTYKIKHFDLSKHLLDLSQKKEFNEAATIYPVLQKEDFHLLNVYFLRQKLRELKEEINELSDGLTESWPAGHRAGAKPATRFDLPRQNYFNMTHMFFPDDFANVRLHTEAELLDLQNIIREVTAKSEENDKNLQFKQLVNGYRTFDLSRGMDYVLDLEYFDKKSLKTAIKRFEVCKPLGKVEFMPVPYVTENTRVTIFLIIQENEIGDAKVFLDGYSNIMSDKKDKNFLMLVLLYQYNTSSKGNDDIFYEMKNFATKMAVKYKNEDTKIAWVSVRIPISDKHLTINDNRALNFAVVDLALKKVGVDNLLLILDPYCNISTDFLNRVRMNTIQNVQVFSPIPFRQFDPKISLQKQFEINKNCGHFDREEYKYVSFYGRDYVQARKKIQHIVPIIRVDNDIININKDIYRKRGNIFEMFVKYGGQNLHCMRATEPSLLIAYHEELDQGRCNAFVGNEKQLAKWLLSHRGVISEIF